MTGSQSLGTAAVWTATGAWALAGMHASATDLRRRVISRRACWSAATAITLLLVTAALAYGSPGRLLVLAIGFVPVLAAGEVLYRIRPAAIGYGDIRLINTSSILAAWWGPQWPWWALLGGAALAVPQAITARTRHRTDATIAWAPALTAGTALVTATRLIAAGTAP